MSEIQALVHSRAAPPESLAGSPRVSSSARLTNFYPLYGADNDQVDPVLRVQPVQFQRVIPRYRLSTSETRDQGVGPMFAGIPESPGPLPIGEPGLARGEAAAGARRDRLPGQSEAARRSPLPVPEPWLGRRVNLLA